MNYILNGKIPVLEPELLVWAQWFESADRAVAKTKIDDIRVSTVFLGIDHSFGSGKPILFETMIFGGDLNEEMMRYSTWEEALDGHQQMVDKVKGVEVFEA